METFVNKYPYIGEMQLRIFFILQQWPSKMQFSVNMEDHSCIIQSAKFRNDNNKH